MREVPLYRWTRDMMCVVLEGSLGTAAERRGNDLKGLIDFVLKDQAIVLSSLPNMCHIGSTLIRICVGSPGTILYR